jgi:hypothetical protein
MTLTNETSRNAAAQIHEDVNLKKPTAGQYQDTIARHENVRLPSGQVLSPEAQIMFSKSIVAKPLGAPASEEIRIKNLSYHYYWGNRSGVNGRRYAQLKAMGYENATLDDVQPMAVEIKKEQAEICLGDLILMKIPIGRWMAHEKAKMERALMLQRRTRTSFDRNPNPDVNSDEAPVLVDAQNQNAGDGKYMQHFQPSAAELDGKMGPDRISGKGK